MPVPKATVDEDDSSVLWKDDIGSARKTLVIYLITES